MTLEQIRHFCAAAEHLNLTKASEEIFVSRTSISRSIRALEEEFDLVFLVRDSRKVRLTPAGQVMYTHCRQILAAADAIQQDLAQRSAAVNRKITLGSPGMVYPPISAFFSEFQNAFPDITLNLSIEDPPMLVQKLCSGDLDGAFFYNFRNAKLPDLLEFIPFPSAEGRYILCVSPYHELAKTFSGDLKELEKYHNIYPSNNLTQIFATNPPDDVPQNFESDLIKISMQVWLGDALAILPEHTAAFLPKECCVQLPLNTKEASYNLGFLYPKTRRNSVIHLFLDELYSFFKIE